MIVVALMACKGADFNTTGETVIGLTISPSSATLVVNSSKAFLPSGGVGPYTFKCVSCASGGAITTAGVYTAGATSPAIDIIEVVDSQGTPRTARATITVNPALAISPLPVATVMTGDRQTISATGGVPPYKYNIVPNNSLGLIHLTLGGYVAGNSSGTDTILVTDSVGTKVTTNIVVNPAITITPPSLYATTNTTFDFVGSGGVGAITFSCLTCPSGKGVSINSPPGHYDGAAGLIPSTDLIQLIDTATPSAHTVTAAINVVPVVSMTAPASGTTIPSNSGLTAVAANGVPPYKYTTTIQSGSFSTNPSISLMTGAFSGGVATSALGVARITVTDSDVPVANTSFVDVSMLGMPTVTSITPTSGSALGGTSVVITGTNFSPSGNYVLVGSTICNGISETTTQITCRTSAHLDLGSSGPVTVEDMYGQVGVKNNAYRYLNPTLYSTLLGDGEVYPALAIDPFITSNPTADSSPNVSIFASDSVDSYTVGPADKLSKNGVPNCNFTDMGIRSLSFTPDGQKMYGLSRTNRIVEVDPTSCATTVLDGDTSQFHPLCPFALTLTCTTATVSLTCTANGTATLSSCTTPTSTVLKGAAISGTGVPPGTTIVSITDAATLVLSNPVAAGAGVTFTFASNVLTGCGPTPTTDIVLGTTVGGDGIVPGTTATLLPSGTSVALSAPVTVKAGAVPSALTTPFNFTGSSNSVTSDCSLADPRFQSISMGMGASNKSVTLTCDVATGSTGVTNCKPQILDSILPGSLVTAPSGIGAGTLISSINKVPPTNPTINLNQVGTASVTTSVTITPNFAYKLYLYDYAGQLFDYQTLGVPVLTVSPRQRSVFYH